MTNGLMVAIGIILLSGCGDNGSVGKPVNKSEFAQSGLKWPLTVGQGSIGCDGNSYWFKTVDGEKYGLNGFATEASGYKNLDSIWAVDDEMMSKLREAGIKDGPTMRVNVGDMIQEASKLCS